MKKAHPNKKAFPDKIGVELIPDVDGRGVTARIPGIPAYGEGDTEQEAIDNLKEGLALFIEERGVQEAVSRMTGVEKIFFVDWDLGNLSNGG